MSAIITDEDVALDAIANDDLGNQAATQLQCFRATTIAEVGGLVSPSGAETPAPTGEELVKTVFGETIKADLGKKDASKYTGAAQSSLLAAQADFGKALIDKDASKYDGVAKRNLLAAQGDFGKALVDKDARKYSGFARTNLLAAQGDIGKTLMEKDSSKYNGASQSTIVAAQNNEGKNYLDWKAKDPNHEAAIGEARSKIAKYTTDKRVFGLSSPDGTKTTPLDPEAAFRRLIGVYDSNTMQDANYSKKRKYFFDSTDRAIQHEQSADRSKRWFVTSGVRICAGSRNKDDSMPDFVPFSSVPLKVCTNCDKTYPTIIGLNQHKKNTGH